MTTLHAKVVAAIVENDVAGFRSLLNADSSLILRAWPEDHLLESGVFHWLYVGDTYLHLAAAGYRLEIARLLLTAGSDPNSRLNRRRATPLHYAADGFITGPAWNPDDQVQTLALLCDSGAGLEAQDSNGASALHRAVRTRCAAAVEILLDRGANPTLPNHSGSTPFHLAVQQTGRGGSGETLALEAQRRIVESFVRRGVSPELKDGRGATVRERATRSWVKALLPNGDA